jgi:hypothetical protein
MRRRNPDRRRVSGHRSRYRIGLNLNPWTASAPRLRRQLRSARFCDFAPLRGSPDMGTRELGPTTSVGNVPFAAKKLNNWPQRGDGFGRSAAETRRRSGLRGRIYGWSRNTFKSEHRLQLAIAPFRADYSWRGRAGASEQPKPIRMRRTENTGSRSLSGAASASRSPYSHAHSLKK